MGARARTDELGTDEERFFFVHLQKTAGTSLARRLRRQFPGDAFYPDASDGDPIVDGPQFAVTRLLDRWPVRCGDVRMLTGHFPLCTAELLGGGFTCFTVLREPVERTLSYLRHHRTLTPADADLPLEAIYDDDFRFEGLVHNHMVKMLGLTLAEMDAGMLTRVAFGPEHLVRAKDNLQALATFGLQARLEDFCNELHQRYGWDVGNAVVSNKTESVEVSDAFRARIAHDNAMDVELYEFAVARYEERHPASR